MVQSRSLRKFSSLTKNAPHSLNSWRMRRLHRRTLWPVPRSCRELLRTSYKSHPLKLRVWNRDRSSRERGDKGNFEIPGKLDSLEEKMMKRILSMKVILLLIAVCVPNVFAQEKPKDQEQRPEEYRFTLASLKVQIVFTEYEGDKKIKSLPYSFLITTRTRDAHPEAKIRIG